MIENELNEMYTRVVLADVVDAWIKQREKGFSIDHDAQHADGELSFAAIAYAIHGLCHPRKLILHRDCHELWPWRDSFKPKGRRENLVRAAAFLLSELVRLDATTDKFSREPAHCVTCGHETYLVPRPSACPDCGSEGAWGSKYAPKPSAEQRAKAIDAWKRSQLESRKDGN